jgi:hypothetical protein
VPPLRVVPTIASASTGRVGMGAGDRVWPACAAVRRRRGRAHAERTWSVELMAGAGVAGGVPRSHRRSSVHRGANTIGAFASCSAGNSAPGGSPRAHATRQRTECQAAVRLIRSPRTGISSGARTELMRIDERLANDPPHDAIDRVRLGPVVVVQIRGRPPNKLVRHRGRTRWRPAARSRMTRPRRRAIPRTITAYGHRNTGIWPAGLPAAASTRLSTTAGVRPAATWLRAATPAGYPQQPQPGYANQAPLRPPNYTTARHGDATRTRPDGNPRPLALPCQNGMTVGYCNTQAASAHSLRHRG